MSVRGSHPLNVPDGPADQPLEKKVIVGCPACAWNAYVSVSELPLTREQFDSRLCLNDKPGHEGECPMWKEEPT